MSESEPGVTPRVQRIYHISDVHVRLYDRRDEYEAVLQELLTFIRLEASPSAMIVLTGDVMHTKNKLSPESLAFVCRMLRSLADLHPTFVIAGNHDMLLHHSDCLDSITPIVDALNHPSLHYCKYTGVTTFRNVHLAVSSLLDRGFCAAKDVPVQSDDAFRIALYHGMVGTIQTSRGTSLSGEVHVADFDGFDAVLLGDIHKFMYLNPQRTMAYASSLCSQNFSEIDDHHGVLVWELHYDAPKRVSSFYHPIVNPYAHREYDIDDAHPWLHGDESYTPPLPSHGRVRVNDQTTNRASFLAVLGQLQRRLHTCTFLEACIRPHSTSLRRTADQATVESSQTPSSTLVPMRHLCAEFLAQSPTVSTSPIVQKTVDLLCTATEQQPQMGATWTVESMSFVNLMGYGHDVKHTLDFSQLNEPIVGIFAPNSYGKSSLFDIIAYLLFGRMIRTSKVQESTLHILHRAADVGEGELIVRVGTSVYRVYKRLVRDKKNRSGVKTAADTVHELVAIEAGCDAPDVPYETSAPSTSESAGRFRFRGVPYRLTSRFDDKHGEKSSFASLIGTYEQFVFSNVYIPNKTKSFARGMTQTERKEMLVQLLCIPSIPTHTQSLQSELTLTNRRLKSKRSKNEHIAKEYNDDAKLELDWQLAQRTREWSESTERAHALRVTLERHHHQRAQRERVGDLRREYERMCTVRAVLAEEIAALERRLSPDSLEVLAERKRVLDAEYAVYTRTVQAEIEGLLSSIQVEQPAGPAVLDDTMTADEVEVRWEETLRIRTLEVTMVEQYTPDDKTNRRRYKDGARDVAGRLDVESKRLVAMSHDYPLQRTLFDALSALQAQAPSAEIVERKRVHDEERACRRRRIQAESDERALGMRALVACTFVNESRLDVPELERRCAADDEEIATWTRQTQDERAHIQQYTESMGHTRRTYKDERKRLSAALATQQATLHEMARRNGEAVFTADGLERLRADHQAVLDKSTEQMETGRRLLATHTQLIADYAVYAHDEHDLAELLRRREAFAGMAFNPDCAQCQANPMREELSRIDDRLRQLDERKAPRDVATHRKNESEQRIPVITERIQQATRLLDAETHDWEAKQSAYLTGLRDTQRMLEQQAVCHDLAESLRQTRDEWRRSDAYACYKRYKPAVRSHSETMAQLATARDRRTQVAAYIQNEQSTVHNATLHVHIAELAAQLRALDEDDAIDRAYAQYVAHGAQLESVGKEHERIVLTNTRHQIQQEHVATLQHELDELRRAWRGSASKHRYTDHKRAQTTHMETLQALHRLEEQRTLHRVLAHNESVRRHNRQVDECIGECRRRLEVHSRVTYDEYDANVAIRSQIHPKREELVRVDAQCARLESELAPFGTPDDDGPAMSDVDATRMQQTCDAEQATCDALQASCTALRTQLAAFLAQRNKSLERNRTIDALEHDARALELSLEMLSERGVVACWFERALTMIQSAVNTFASPLLGRRLSFTCVGERIEIGFASDAHDGAIPVFGGMESVVVDLAIQMALAELTRSVRCNLFIIDEAFFVMDQHNRMQVPRLLHELQQKYQHVFVISHDSFIHDVIHQEIQITTRNDIKTIQITGACV